MHKGAANENVLGFPLEERKRMQEEAIAADNEIFTQENAINGENILTNPDNYGIMNIETGSENNMNENMFGGISGALNKDSPEAAKHADLYYEEIRKRKSDVTTIAQNTAFTENQVKSIKEHLFLNEITFANGTIKRFDPDFEQAQAWQRLISGNFYDTDILFLNHELEELEYMRNNNVVYEIAHEHANKKYNWEYSIRGKGGE